MPYDLCGTIHISLSNSLADSVAGHPEKDRMNIRIDFTGNLHSKDKYYFTYLQMFNRKKNKILEIPIEFYKNNQIDKIITFEKIFENVDEFTKLIDEYYFELKLFFSELEIGNN